MSKKARMQELEAETKKVEEQPTETLDDHKTRIARLEGKQMDATPQENPDGGSKKEKAEAKSGSEPEVEPITVKKAVRGRYDLTDGPHKMWQWWDHERRVWRGPSEAITTALSAVGGDASLVRAVSVWTKNGRIDHFLSGEEIERYLP